MGATASLPSSRNAQSVSRSWIPPGRRSPRPTMASGSCCLSSHARRRVSLLWSSWVRRRKYSVSVSLVTVDIDAISELLVDQANEFVGVRGAELLGEREDVGAFGAGRALPQEGAEARRAVVA